MNDKLSELEEQLADMPTKKLYFIYVSIIVLLVYTAWNLFGENMRLEIETKENSIESLQKKLKDNNVKSFESTIIKIDKESLTIKEELNELSLKEKYIASKLESIDFIFFNQKGIVSILDSILKHSITYSVDIDIIKYKSVNTLYLPNVYEREQINIDGSASYKNIVQLLQHIDSLNALLRINAININVDENQTTNFDLNISQYGVQL